jgi:hypothetical protein
MDILDPRPESFKRRLQRFVLRAMVKTKLISIDETEVAVAPKRPRLEGNALWAFRAWTYLPLPIIFAAIFTTMQFKGSPVEYWITLGMIVVAGAILFVMVGRSERKSGLRLPNVSEIVNFLVRNLMIAVAILITNFIERGRVNWAGALLIPAMVGLTAITLPYASIFSTDWNSKDEKPEVQS